VATPRTREPRGRRPKPFLDDPERYHIAFSDALIALGVTEPEAYALTAALMLGEEASSDGGPECRITFVKKRGRDEPTTTILGKADTLRGKAKHRPRKGRGKPYSREEHFWRSRMGLCFMIVLNAKDQARCAEKVRHLASEIGEDSFCERVLIPMLTVKFTTPDFSPPD
jgi:hypothetical protein